MIDERERYERAFGLFEMPEPAFERLVRRRDRKRRNERIAAGAIGLVLAAAVLGGWLQALRFDRPVPADHGVAPTPSPSMTATGPTRTHYWKGLTFAAPRDWKVTWDTGDEFVIAPRGSERAVVVIGIDPGVPSASSPAPAEEIVRWITERPELDATVQPVTVGGIEGVQLDIVSTPGASTVDVIAVHEYASGWHEYGVSPDERMRILVFTPSRTVAIVIIAPKESFEQFAAEAAVIVESVEL